MYLKRSQEALEAVESAIQLNPNQSSAYKAKAAALILLDRPNEAIVAFDQALQIKADPATYLAKGKALSDMGRFEDARSTYNQSLLLDPNNATTYEYKAQALERLGMFYEASREIEKAQQIVDKHLTSNA